MKLRHRHSLSTLFAVAASAVFTWHASAAPITWSTSLATTSGGYGQTLNTGLFNSASVVYAENTGGTAQSFDGISFGAGTITFSGGGPYSGFHEGGKPSQSGYYGTGVGTVTLGTGSMPALNIGQSYQVQLLIFDGRGSSTGRTISVDGVSQGAYGYGVQNVTYGNGRLVTGTFTADAATQAFTLQGFDSGGSSVGPQLNALVLNTVTPPPPLTLVAEYHLGETGSLSGPNSKPLDSLGVRSFTNANYFAGATPTGTSGVYAPGSTDYLDTSDTTKQEGFWGPSYTLPGSDNFGFGIFVRAASNTSTTRGSIFSLGGPSDTNVLKVGLGSGGWYGTANNAAWIGPADGTGFVADQWVHLALIRSSGVTTFYINGVAQSAPWSGTPSIGVAHLNVDAGGGTAFDGNIDEARVVTFLPGQTATDILNLLTNGSQDRLVRDGVKTLNKVAFGAAKTSEYRPGLDVTTVNDPDGFSVTGPHTLQIVATPGLTPGLYDLVNYTSATPVNLADFTLQLPTRMSATLQADTSAAPLNRVQLDITDFGTVVWNGNVDSNWDTGSAANVGGTNNWVSNALTTNFIEGDNVVFDETAANLNVSINGADVSPAAVVIDNLETFDYVFSGTNGITGTAPITKISAGKATLAMTNSNTGTTTITGGTLQLGNGSTTGSLGSGNIVNSGTLVFNWSDDHGLANNITGSGSIEQNGGGMTTLNGSAEASLVSVNAGTLKYTGNTTALSHTIATGAVLELNTAAATVYAVYSTFSGTGTLRKTGSGAARWSSNVATFALASGAVIDVAGGTFFGSSDANENWTANLADLTVASGATFNGVEGNIRVDALSGDGTITSGWTGEGYQNFTFGVDNGSGTFDGVLKDYVSGTVRPGNYVKAGSGTQTLSGANTYTGYTKVAAGTLSLGQAYLADASDVFITTGATLDLSHGQTDQIDQLFLDDVAQPSGLYGSLASDAPIKVAYITGSGKLQVGGYTTWAATNAGGQTADLDFDKDGVINGIEYFMGATGSSFTANPAVVNSTVTWPIGATYTGVYGTDYIVQTSSNLTNWTPATVGVGAGFVVITPGTSVSYTLPPGAEKSFVRLLVTP